MTCPETEYGFLFEKQELVPAIVQDEKTGEVVEKNISASEMNKRRLEYARKLDEERYKDERTVPLSELEDKKED